MTTVSVLRSLARGGAVLPLALLLATCHLDRLITDPSSPGAAPGERRLVFTGPPADVAAGETFATPVAVLAVDANGAADTAFTASIVITLGANPGGASLGGLNTAEAVDGVAEFPTLVLDRVGSGYTLVARAAGYADVASPAFDVVAPGGDRMFRVGGDGQSGTVGTVLPAPFRVRVTDASGAGIGGVPVAWAVTSGGGTIAPGSASTDADGYAEAVRTLGTGPGPQQATASAGGLTGSPVTFSAIAVPGPATSLVFTAQPSDADVGAVISPAPTVTAQDPYGNTATGFTGSVTVALGANPGGATLSGTTTRGAVAGVVSFTGLSLDRAGDNYTLRAAVGGVTSVTSTAFDIRGGSSGPATLVRVSGEAQSGVVGATLAPFRVRVTDAAGAGVSGITVSWAVTGGGGSIGPAATTTDGDGYAEAVRTLGTSPGSQLATASVAGLSGSPTVFTATAVPDVPATLTFSQQPTDTRTGAAITPAVRVVLRDRFGNLATNFSGAVTVAITPGTGTPLALLSGSLSRPASGGEVVFDDLRINLIGIGYRLRAAAGGLTHDSAPFEITL